LLEATAYFITKHLISGACFARCVMYTSTQIKAFNLEQQSKAAALCNVDLPKSVQTIGPLNSECDQNRLMNVVQKDFFEDIIIHVLLAIVDASSFKRRNSTWS
jgi:hypothetical protein